MTLDKIKCTGLELDTAQEVNGFFYTENGYVMYGCKPDLNQPCVRHYIIDEDGYHREVASGTVELILEQQMNDKQESAMSISERDIENAFIKQQDAEVERELSENDEWVNGDICTVDDYNGEWQYGCDVPSTDLVILFRAGSSSHMTMPKCRLIRPLTPEQLAAAAVRDEWIDNVCNEICISDDYIIGLMYDAGYRK